MKKIYFLLVAAMQLVCTVNFGQHSLPIYEPFDGKLGNLAGQKGWTGNTTTGNAAQVVDFALKYPGLFAVDSSYSVLFGSQTSGGTQALGFVSQTTTVYASLLIQVSSLPLSLANSRYNFGYGSTTTGGTFAGCMYVVPTGANNFELGFNGTNSQPTSTNTTSLNFALNTTIMVVMAYTPGLSGEGKVSAWVNPDSAFFGDANAPTPTFSNIGGGTINSVASVFIRSGSNTNPMTIDELRVATSWADVTSYNVALPVSISGLSVTTSNRTSTISWTSNIELNFDKYVVMYSKNSSDYSEIGTVRGKGSNTNYSFSYAHDGEAYFKIKMVDLDGTAVFSKVLYARGKSLSVKMGPNPFTDKIFISELPDGPSTAILYTENGQKLLTQNGRDSNMTLALTTLPAGKYVLNVLNDGKVILSQVVIKQ